MIPELIQAIMKFIPDYFTWDEKRQEEYRVHMPEEDEFAIPGRPSRLTTQFLLAG